VVVQANEIEWLTDQPRISRAKDTGHLGQGFPGIRGDRAAEQSIQEGGVAELLYLLRGIHILWGIRGRVNARLILSDADVQGGTGGAQRLGGQAGGNEQMMGNPQGEGRIPSPRGMGSDGVAQVHHDPRFVDRDLEAHAVAEASGRHAGIVGKCVARIAVGPTPSLLKSLRKVPGVERGKWLNVGCPQCIHQLVVEVETRVIAETAAGGQDPRPGNGETVGLEAQAAHERDVRLPPVVVIAGDLSRLAVGDAPRLLREEVPDRLALSVGVPGTLDLIG
jgi:hypothetical protein